MSKTGNQLMSQKVNVTPELIQHWNFCMNEEVKHLINRYMLTMEDCDTATFQLKNRTFTLIGMVAGGNTIVREDTETGPLYWECSANLVQQRLGRLKTQWEAGTEKAVLVDYDESELYLKSVNRRKKAAVIEDDFIELDEDADDIVHVDIDDIDENELGFEEIL